MNFLDKWNKSKFNVYTSEEKTVLKLISKISDFIADLSQGVDEKTDINGNHLGSWQGINRPTLSDEGMRGTVEKNQADINNIKGKSINILDLGAKGDGITDNTEVFIKLFNDVKDNTTIIIPSGEYIVYKDFNGVTSGNALDISKCILMRDKKNIKIEGQGDVLIRTNKQGNSPDKRRFPCILSFDKCINIELFNVTVESKGMNYGDADSGLSVSQGDERTNFVIQNGGSAILVTRCINHTINNVKARLTGSCAVIYHSNVTNAIVKNTFANALSSGYASFTIDEFVHNSVDYDSTITYENCSTFKETLIRENRQIGESLVSGKSGFVIEGGLVPIKCKILNCYIANSSHNGADTYLGSAIISYNARTEVNNVFVDTCNRVFYKRDILTNEGYLSMTNVVGKNLLTNGGVIKDLYSVSPINNNLISNCKFEVIGNTLFPGAADYLQHPSGIAFCEYSDNSNKTIINNCYIKSPKNAIFGLYRDNIELNNNVLISDTDTVSLLGGGISELSNNTIKKLNDTLTDGENLRISTRANDGTISVTETSIINNSFIGANKSKNAITVVTSNADLVSLKGFKNNSLTNCCVNAEYNNISIPGEIRFTKLIKNSDLVGNYTSLVFDFSNNVGVTKDVFIIDDNGFLRKLIKQGRIVEDNIYKEIFYVEGDLRSAFTLNNIYHLI